MVLTTPKTDLLASLAQKGGSEQGPAKDKSEIDEQENRGTGHTLYPAIRTWMAVEISSPWYRLRRAAITALVVKPHPSVMSERSVETFKSIPLEARTKRLRKGLTNVRLSNDILFVRELDTRDWAGEHEGKPRGIFRHCLKGMNGNEGPLRKKKTHLVGIRLYRIAPLPVLLDRHGARITWTPGLWDDLPIYIKIVCVGEKNAVTIAGHGTIYSAHDDEWA
jgi:hypothetical protein